MSSFRPDGINGMLAYVCCEFLHFSFGVWIYFLYLVWILLYYLFGFVLGYDSAHEVQDMEPSVVCFGNPGVLV